MSRFFLILVLLSFGIMSSCSKDYSYEGGLIPDTDNPQFDVYISGRAEGMPGYWKNGAWTTLTSQSQLDAIATAITVVDKDVYVAGTEGGMFTLDKSRAKYWKNGEEIFLTEPIGAGASAIAVEGSEVYVAGWERAGDESIAVYWKNGNRVALTDGKSIAGTWSITINKGDVYVTGTDDNQARYWKNGQPFSLTNGSTYALATSLALSGSEVIVGGFESDGSINQPKYWKNGQAFSVTGGAYGSEIHAIVRSGSDIYLAGIDFRPGPVAVYWKNGQMVDLSSPSVMGGAIDLAVTGKDIYVAGEDDRVATVWKNGQGLPLKSPNGQPVVSGVLGAVSDMTVVRR